MPEHFGGSLTRICFSPDGKRLLIGNYLGRLFTRGIEPGAAKLDFSGSALGVENGINLSAHNGAVKGITFTRDGRYVISVSQGEKIRGADPGLRVWDYMSRFEVRHEVRPTPYAWLATSPDGSRIALGTQGGTAEVWLAQAR